MSSHEQWYAVYTKPRWEKKVAELLTKKAIQNYCPLNRVRKQWADRKKIVLEPLFISYVFVKVAVAEHLKVKQTRGVINMVYWLGKPAVISDNEIDIIQRFLNEHCNVRLEQNRLNVNDNIRVCSGPLMEHTGQVISIKNKTVKVVLPSLGFIMNAEVQATSVERIDVHNVSCVGRLNHYH